MAIKKTAQQQTAQQQTAQRQFLTVPVRKPDWVPGDNPLLSRFAQAQSKISEMRERFEEAKNENQKMSREDIVKASAMFNGLLLEFEFTGRSICICDYAFCIPGEEALEAICAAGPIIEVGCGTGYWAKLLQERGCDIIATDHGFETPAEEGGYNFKHTWLPVERVDAQEAASRHPDRTLLTVWPPYMDATAERFLAAYTAAGGRKVIYAGEGLGGCTATDRFHEILDRNYAIERVIELPRWRGCHDGLEIWARI